MTSVAINFGALFGFYGNLKIRLFIVYMTDFLIFFPHQIHLIPVPCPDSKICW